MDGKKLIRLYLNLQLLRQNPVIYVITPANRSKGMCLYGFQHSYGKNQIEI